MTYVMIHNGVINSENALELKSEHKKKYGIEYTSVQKNGDFNDSEALLWELALYLEGKQEKLNTKGRAAFVLIAMERNKTKPYGGNEGDKLYFGHNSGSPLRYIFTGQRFMIASENIFGSGSQVQENQLYTFQHTTKMLNFTKLEIPEYRYVPHTPLKYRTNTQIKLPSGIKIADKTILTMKDVTPEEQKIITDIRNELRDDVSDKKVNEMAERFHLLKIARDIKHKVTDNMECANGYFEIAYGLINEDILRISDSSWELDKEYKLEILKGAQAVLLADPFWEQEDEESRHPKFSSDQSEKSKTHAIKAAIIGLSNKKADLVNDNVCQTNQIAMAT